MNFAGLILIVMPIQSIVDNFISRKACAIYVFTHADMLSVFFQKGVMIYYMHRDTLGIYRHISKLTGTSMIRNHNFVASCLSNILSFSIIYLITFTKMLLLTQCRLKAIMQKQMVQSRISTDSFHNELHLKILFSYILQ